MRRLAILLVLMAGCGQAVDTDAVDTLVAVGGAYAIQAAPQPVPAPDSDQCPDCNGKGFVGDGVVRTICNTCDGTGRVVKHPPVVVQ